MTWKMRGTGSDLSSVWPFATLFPNDRNADYDAAANMRAGGWKLVNFPGRYLEMVDHNVWT